MRRIGPKLRYAGTVRRASDEAAGNIVWNHWFRPTLDWIHENPNIKTFTYWNEDFGTYPWGGDWKKDCRLGQNWRVAANFRAELENPVYLHRGQWSDPLESVLANRFVYNPATGEPLAHLTPDGGLHLLRNTFREAPGYLSIVDGTPLDNLGNAMLDFTPALKVVGFAPGYPDVPMLLALIDAATGNMYLAGDVEQATSSLPPVDGNPSISSTGSMRQKLRSCLFWPSANTAKSDIPGTSRIAKTEGQQRQYRILTYHDCRAIIVVAELAHTKRRMTIRGTYLRNDIWAGAAIPMCVVTFTNKLRRTFHFLP